MSGNTPTEKSGKTTTEVIPSPPGSPKSTLQMRDVEKAEPEKVAATADETSVDPNIVDWDGPDDPQKPLNWPARRKWRNVFTISALTLLTPFGSTMFAPAVPETMREFHSTNVDLAAFVVSVFVLGYAFGPLIIAPMSELYGRIWVYHVNTALFVIFNIACALSSSLPMLIIWRFFAGFAGVTPLTIGSGTISDMFRQDERGRVMSLWTFPVLLGPTVGPIAGSYLGESAGWRWTFWCLAILVSVHHVDKAVY
jgi:multidrug resistance protein